MADPFTARKSGIFVPRDFSLTYEGANPNRQRQYRQIVATDTKRTITPWVRTTLMSHGRHLYANNGLVGGAFDDTARYALGSDGIVPEPMTGDTGYDFELKERWLNWAKIADFFRESHLNELGGNASTHGDTDGDFYLLLTETGGGNTEPGGMAQVQALRGHRIGSGNMQTAVGPQMNDGVIEDSLGRLVGYRVLNGDGEKERDVDAVNIIKFMQRYFSDQRRGISAIHRGAKIMFDAAETMDFTQMAVKNWAQTSMVIKTPTGEADEQDYLDDDGNEVTEGGLLLEELQGGEIRRLGPGEEIQDVTSPHPQERLMDWTEFRYRDFATGYGMPLEFIWRSDLGGPAQRFFLSKAQRRIDERISLLIRLIYRRLWAYWYGKEVKRKAIKYNENWWKVLFLPTSPRVTIDVGREAQANRDDIAFGNRTEQEDAAERGRDWLHIRRQKKTETELLIDDAKDLANRKDIPFDVALMLLSKRTPNGNMPTAPAPGTSPVSG